MRVLLSASVAAAALFAAASANATIIYQTDFEAPNFAVGGINGQGGWATFSAPGASTIETVGAIGGLQSAKVTGSLTTGQTGPFHSDASAISLITVSADILLTSTTLPADLRSWQFSAIGAGLTGFTGGIDIDANGNIRAITQGFTSIGVFSRDMIHRVDLLLDYGAETFGVKLDGVTLASGLAFCGDNGPCGGAAPGLTYNSLLFDTFGAQGGDAGYLDNIIVQSTPGVPEPSAWALMIAGFGLAGSVLRRRRVAAA